MGVAEEEAALKQARLLLHERIEQRHCLGVPAQAGFRLPLVAQKTAEVDISAG